MKCCTEGREPRANYGLFGSLSSYCIGQTTMPPTAQSHRQKSGSAPRSKNKQCQVAGCEKIPTFGYPGQNRTCCHEHMESGMFPSKGLKCQEKDCPVTASFGPPGGGSLTCSAHREIGYLNIKNRVKWLADHKGESNSHVQMFK